MGTPPVAAAAFHHAAPDPARRCHAPDAAGSGPYAAPVLLVGRDVPLAACSAALDDAAGGRGRVVLLAGEAGIGKTTLARAVADEAAGAGAVVRWTAAWEGGDVPFAPWIEALRVPGGDACEEAAVRLADGSGVDTDDPTATEHLRLHLFAGVVDALRAAAAAVPQVLVLDDLHWADTTSLLLLRAVAAHAPTMRLLVVGTYRDDEVRAGSPLLALGGSAECHGLTGLRERDVAELLTAVVGRELGPDESRSVSRQTGGNPLFVTHVGRLLAAGSPMGVPTGVRDVLARRLARLPAASDDVLGAAAVLGHEFEPAVVAEILGAPVPDVLGALDAAAAARIAVPVDGRPDRWTFTHALVRTARYDGLGSADRASLHRRASDVLQRRSGTAAAVLAHHAARGSYAADDPTPATLLLHAADEARSRLAIEEALPLYEAALERAARLPDGDELQGVAWLGLGDVRLRMGDAAGAARCFEAGADLARRLEAPDLLARAALGFGAGLGGFEVRLLDQRQTDLLEEAAATLPPSSPLRPLVLARLSVATSFMGSEERRLALADEALALGRAAADLAAVGAALASRCDAIAGPRFTTERLGVAGEIVAIGQRLGDRRLELLGRRHRAAALAELCDLDGFDAEVAAFGRTADVLGDPLYSWYVPLWRGMRAVTSGRLAEGVRLSAEARAIGERAGSPNARVLSQVLDLFVALLFGRVDEVAAGMRILTEELPDA